MFTGCWYSWIVLIFHRIHQHITRSISWHKFGYSFGEYLNMMIQVLVVTVTVLVMGVSSLNTRGVVCKATPAPPTTITDEQQTVAFKCALACMKTGDANCATNGFLVGWDTPAGCHAAGESVTGPSSIYGCSAS